MRYFVNPINDPYYNLALEEYIFTSYTEGSILLLWQNDHAIIIGKNQNTLQEIDMRSVKDLGVKVVRRETGGGAVYHDMGNLNFSFITDWAAGGVDMHFFMTPIIAALNDLGVKAIAQGRNDILVDGFKISGNAQTVKKGRILHHGTILVHSNLNILSKVLTPNEEKFSSKGIKSVRSRVANISDFVSGGLSVADVANKIVEHYAKDYLPLNLSDEDFFKIKELAEKKYSTWEWNYGYSPRFTYANAAKLPCGKVEINVNVDSNGAISQCRIFGDFISLSPIEDVENALIGKRLTLKDIGEVLAHMDLMQYFGNSTFDEIIALFNFCN